MDNKNNLIKLALLALIIVLAGWIIKLEFFEIPDLEKNLSEFRNQSSDTTETITKTVVDTLVVVKKDTVFVPDVSEPEIVNETPEYTDYKTRFGDSMLTGIVNSRVAGILQKVEVEYQYKRDIISTKELEIRTITVTNNIVQYKREPLRGLDIGLMTGYIPTEDVYVLAPSLGWHDGKKNSISYSYDLVNQGHFLTIRRKLTFPKINFGF